MAWKDLLQPAIDLAANGFSLTRKEAAGLNNNREKFLAANPVPPAFTLKEPWNAGDTIHYPELAETLIRIRDLGKAGFYEGLTADLIIEEMNRAVEDYILRFVPVNCFTQLFNTIIGSS